MLLCHYIVPANCFQKVICEGEQLRHARNVGFELYIGIESKLSILIIGFLFEMGNFCHFDCNAYAVYSDFLCFLWETNFAM